MRTFIILCLVLPVAMLGDSFEGHVIGGSNANIVDYPHQLSLRVSGSHSCGASLVSATKAVTAAHCGGSALVVYSILAGATQRTDTSCSTCVTRNLDSFIRHSEFANNPITGYPNDIATLHFSAIASNSNISPITMATSSASDFSGQNCIITGWGRTVGTNPALPVVLQQGSMQVITNAACASTWGVLSINSGHICVSSSTVGSCRGDSGGPLVCGGTLVGATSWGHSDCLVTYPSVYSRISYFRAWIDSN